MAVKISGAYMRICGKAEPQFVKLSRLSQQKTVPICLRECDEILPQKQLQFSIRTGQECHATAVIAAVCSVNLIFYKQRPQKILKAIIFTTPNRTRKLRFHIWTKKTMVPSGDIDSFVVLRMRGSRCYSIFSNLFFTRKNFLTRRSSAFVLRFERNSKDVER